MAGVVINPAGFSFHSIALLDALKMFDGPKVEVHITNIHKREPMYQKSLISHGVTGVIAGLGGIGYALAVDAIAASGERLSRIAAARLTEPATNNDTSKSSGRERHADQSTTAGHGRDRRTAGRHEAAPLLAQGAKVSLKVGGQFQATHPASMAMEEACAEIRKQSDGRIDIQFFPERPAGLGRGDADAGPLRRARHDDGLRHFDAGGSARRRNQRHGIRIHGLRSRLAGDGWRTRSATIREGLDKVGTLRLPENPRQRLSQHHHQYPADQTVDDFKGLKMRVPPSPVWVSLFTALGSSPTSITINELYSALQTKIVDGQENPLTVIEAGKYYEVQKYCSITEHMWRSGSSPTESGSKHLHLTIWH